MEVKINNDMDKRGQRINSEQDLEQIAIDVIKLMLDSKVPFEDIQHITGKSIEEIKRIGGIDD